MIAGHFGLAAIVKAKEPATPLWALMLATAWLDVVFIPLFALGIETIEPAPGTSGGYGAGIIHADYTHSLVGALVLSALFGWVAAWQWGRRVGLVLGAVAFSHWVLDLLVHRADLPILPANLGGLPLLGFGLWQSTAASVLAELALLLAGAFFYWRAATAVTAGKAPELTGRANLAAGVLLVSGFIVLALDVTGILG
ncbi:MAG: hypothetical protein IT535_01010 [Bauldia sp.]|nr:hypothetical protein [Bauldia sp.]